MSAPKPYSGQPDGLFFIGRFPKSKKYNGYNEMVITKAGILAVLCNDGKWYPFRKTTPADLEIVKACFKTWTEVDFFYDNLLIAA